LSRRLSLSLLSRGRDRLSRRLRRGRSACRWICRLRRSRDRRRRTLVYTGVACRCCLIRSGVGRRRRLTDGRVDCPSRFTKKITHASSPPGAAIASDDHPWGSAHRRGQLPLPQLSAIAYQRLGGLKPSPGLNAVQLPRIRARRFDSSGARPILDLPGADRDEEPDGEAVDDGEPVEDQVLTRVGMDLEVEGRGDLDRRNGAAAGAPRALPAPSGWVSPTG
jgi:hypothetical protein